MSRTPSRDRSLIRRVMAALFAAIALVFVISGLVFAHSLRQQAERDMDIRLRTIALDLFAGLTFDEDGTAVLNRIPERAEFDDRLSGWYWQIRLDGRTIARSRSLLLQDLAMPPDRHGTIAGPNGLMLRTATVERELPERGGHGSVQVSAPQREIDDVVAAELRLLAGGMVALLALLLAVTGWLLVRGLSPLRAIQRDLAAMVSGSADTLRPTGFRELDGMVALINAMAERSRQQIATHREAANKLAHALKTPLALIAARTGASGATPDPDIQASIVAMRSHIEHNLSRARLAGAQQGIAQRVPIAPIVNDLMFAFAHAYRDRNIAQHIDVAPGAAFLGDKDDAVELIGNILDNAHRFARSRVALEARPDRNDLLVRISDDGPGLREAAGSTVVTAGQGAGSGLGLAIAQEIVEAYAGSLTFEANSAEGGLDVLVRLPAVHPGRKERPDQRL
ncbi:MAG: hypothetical protein IT536_08595 [Hyphomicrobiales bacterium]|nr:hypothetical protein [Hyphomicrobiales bacterium]